MIQIDESCAELRSLLEKAVLRNLSEGILLSGGLDTSIIAYLASHHAKLKGFTVAFDGAPAPDLEYARLIAESLDIDHTVHIFDERELFESIPMVIKVVKSFDPMEIRNSVSILIGLNLAKGRGVKSMMTGDGSDELFAGYSFLFNLNKEELEDRLYKIWGDMFFSSIPMGRFLGIDVKLPYLDPELKSYVMNLDSGYKIKSEEHQIWGKWVLRKAFEECLPEFIVWRVKTPIEYGSGTTVLTDIFEKRIEDSEFEEKKQRYMNEDRVIIRDKEQLYYYEIYRSVIGVPHKMVHSCKNCPFCNSDLNETAKYCKVCGAYPV
ncbi:MAG: asparagine synthase-related protein [Candidatus Methylarchaceae archaeon HK01B]|nr:asparagine synthase-related protein [Candidatus Methylarchaceae archaeon HK01B]